jgi:multidrug resistance efflux pump
MNNFEHILTNEKFNDSKSLRSPEINDILSKRQGNITKWTLFLFLFIIFALFMVAYYVNYPDIVTTRARLTGYNAPKEILSIQEGKILKLFVSNDNIVKNGDPLMWIETTANHMQVIRLDNLIDSCINLLNHDSAFNINFFFKINFNQLGELQTAYSNFMFNYQNFSDFYINGYYQNNINVLRLDLNGIEFANKNLLNQKKISEDDLELFEQNYSANEKLFYDKIISKQELRIEKSKLLNKQQVIPQIESSILSNDALKREKIKQIHDLEHSLIQQKNVFVESLHTLKSLVDDWKRKYIVSASIEGKINFTFPLQEKQYIHAGKVFGYINPHKSDYFVEIYLPQKNFGKVHVGQSVQLRFDAYPYNEYGYVKGRMTYVSNVSSDSGFVAKIELPDGLLTSQKSILQYNIGLKADALIITKDLSILKRIYYSLFNNITR